MRVESNGEGECFRTAVEKIGKRRDWGQGGWCICHTHIGNYL